MMVRDESNRDVQEKQVGGRLVGHPTKACDINPVRTDAPIYQALQRVHVPHKRAEYYLTDEMNIELALLVGMNSSLTINSPERTVI